MDAKNSLAISMTRLVIITNILFKFLNLTACESGPIIIEFSLYKGRQDIQSKYVRYIRFNGRCIRILVI